MTKCESSIIAALPKQSLEESENPDIANLEDFETLSAANDISFKEEALNTSSIGNNSKVIEYYEGASLDNMSMITRTTGGDYGHFE